MEELKSERVADQQEILELLTSIARGETTATTLRSVDVGVQTIEEDMPPTIASLYLKHCPGPRWILSSPKNHVITSW